MFEIPQQQPAGSPLAGPQLTIEDQREAPGNLATVAGLIVDSALLRKESRGLHFTLDFPEPDERFRRPTVLRRS